jgi:DNA-binding transcriptional LysR family regulator
MNIELARTFLEVVSSGSLAGAADRLNLTHSAVTMRIKSLEQLIGRRLLVRSKAGVSLTPAGVRFQRHAQALVQAWQQTQRHMSLAPGFQGILSVGADPSLWDDLMCDWACATRRERPEVAIRCESGSAEDLIDALFQGLIDFCVVFEPHSRSGFHIEELFDDPMTLVSSEDRSYLDHFDPAFIQIDWDEGYRASIERYDADRNETPHLSAATASLGLRFLCEFGGSSWIPKRVLESRTFQRPLYPVRGAPAFERTAYLVYSQDAMQEWLPDISIGDVRRSLLNQLAGYDRIWDVDEGAAAATA